MGLIANLAVALTAKTGQFSAKMRGARKEVSDFASTVKSYATGTTAKIAGLAAAVTGVGSLGALVHFTKESMEAIDVQAKLADRIGSTTEELTGLAHAADLAGTDSDTLNSSLDRLTKNIGQGSTAVIAALSQIGLKRQDLLGRGAVEQFAEVAEGVKNLASNEQRAAVATALFGKQGQSLIATLMLGKQGLGDAADEAERLGLTFSRIDAAKVEAANDAMTRFKGVIRGAIQQLGIMASPYIEAISSKLVELTTNGEGMGKTVSSAVELITQAISDMIRGFENAINKVRTFSSAFITGFANLRDALGGSALDRFLDGDGPTVSDSLRGYASGLSEKVGNDMAAQNLGQTASGKFDTLVTSIKSLAESNAKKIADEAAAQNAKSRAMREQLQPFVDRFVSILGDAPSALRSLFEGAGAQAKIDEAYRGVFQSRLANALDPAVEFFSSGGGIRGPNGAAAVSAGTRGTFASEAAGRLSGTFTIQEQQLAAMKDAVDVLNDINSNIEGGLALP